MTLLAGDLGGTKTLLGLYGDDGKLLVSRRFPSQAFASLEAMVAALLDSPEGRAHPRPERAAFGVAGRVEEAGTGQRARITNLSWGIETAKLEQVVGLRRALLVNDFYAVAAATGPLSEGAQDGETLCHLNPGTQAQGRGAIGVLGAGTGLGEAMVVRSTGVPVVMPSEGGHGDFAPRDEVEIALLRFLQQRHGGHVSYERVLSGVGLLALYEFFRGHLQDPLAPPKDLQAALDHDREAAPALISKYGLLGTDQVCGEALNRFAALYGAEAGNLALRALATGGIYLSGGIAPKILAKLREGPFMEGFLAKGRFSAFLATVPVYVMLSEDIGLLGASVLAREV